jgi:hypothetical protein
MTELISWLKEYSPAVVTLVAIGTATLYVLKLTVDKSIAASFDTHVQELELGLERRSAFRDKVLTERFPRITEQSSRLEKVMTNLNRLRHNNPVPEGFQKGNEIVPLTEIYEDLSTLPTLTEGFYELFVKKADLAWSAASAQSQDEWNGIAPEWGRVDEQIRAAVERTFNLSEIKF